MDANIDNKIRTVSFLLQILDSELKELNSIQENERVIIGFSWDTFDGVAEVQMSKDAFWKMFTNCIIKLEGHTEEYDCLSVMSNGIKFFTLVPKE